MLYSLQHPMFVKWFHVHISQCVRYVWIWVKYLIYCCGRMRERVANTALSIRYKVEPYVCRISYCVGRMFGVRLIVLYSTSGAFCRMYQYYVHITNNRFVYLRLTIYAIGMRCSCFGLLVMICATIFRSTWYKFKRNKYRQAKVHVLLLRSSKLEGIEICRRDRHKTI